MYLERYVHDVRAEVGQLVDYALRTAPRRLSEEDTTVGSKVRAAGAEPATTREGAIALPAEPGAGPFAPRLPEGRHPIFPDRRKVAGIVHDARSRTGNFGIGTAGRAEADAAGLVWTGTDARRLPYGNTYRLVSRDGLRQYRPPQQKPSGRAVEANFEQRSDTGRHWESNAHLQIEERQ